MKRETELIKNTFILSLSKFLPKLVSIVTLPIVTACLTKSEYGTYDLIATLIMLLIPIATLQIQSAAFRFLIDCRGDQAKSTSIISNIYVVVLPVSILVSGGIYIFMPNLSNSIKGVMACYFFLDSIESTVAQVARGLGKNKTFSISSILLSIINGIGIVFALKLMDTGLFGVIFSLGIANGVALVYLCAAIKIQKYLKITAINKDTVKELLTYSWPMVPNNLSTWVLKLSDRLVITAFLGIEANAVYAVANKIPNLLSIAQSVLIMAWQENASIAAKDRDAGEYYGKMLDSTFDLMFGCTVLLIAGTPIIFWLLIKGDYYEAYYQMPILILAMFFFVMSSYFGGIYIAYKKTTNVGISTMVAAAVNLGIDLCFVNVIGIWAGSISTLAAYALLYFYRMINCQKFQPVKINLKKQFVEIALLIIMLIMCFMRQVVLNGINLVLGLALFWYFNHSLAETMLKKMMSRKK